jgi:dephospho-CoA kinase
LKENFKHVKKVGITGGIGSGKSTVAKLVNALGYPVYIADDEAKRLIETDVEIRERIIELLGEESYNENGYNRRFVANKVFANNVLLQQLSQIVHPAVAKHFQDWCLSHKGQSIVFQEAAILFENGSYKRFDKTILVVAPEALRLKRVMKRDKLSEKDVLSRMSRQWPDERKMELSDYLVKCDGEHLVIDQILQIIKELKWDY